MVLLYIENAPDAVLLNPVVLLSSELAPDAVLLRPVVLFASEKLKPQLLKKAASGFTPKIYPPPGFDDNIFSAT